MRPHPVQPPVAGQGGVVSGHVGWGWFAAAVGLLALTAALGDSASTPGLGRHTALPPWDLALHPPSGLVTVMLTVAYLCGTVWLLLGLRRLRAGARLDPHVVVVVGLLSVGALLLVPPTGSADHLSYLAYGRIAAAGDDPYLVDPQTWHGGTDPVARAIQPPWQATPSIYGPVATAVQALAARLGGSGLRASVGWWQLLCGIAFLTVGAVLDRLTLRDPSARTRAALLWTLNPLLLGQLVLGAHIDVIAAALAVAGIAVAARCPLVAGALVGAAAGVKAPFALYGLAAVWGVWHLPSVRRLRGLLLGAAGALAVLVPAYWWAGAHAGAQLGKAAARASFASPWHAPFVALRALLGDGVDHVLAPVSLLLAALLGLLLWRRVHALDAPTGDEVVGRAVRAALVAAVAWLLTAPYVLPWYDAIAWAPLALVGANALDGWLVVRLAALALAYVPGRVVELAPWVERLTLGVRTVVAPLVLAVVIVAAVRWGRQRVVPAPAPVAVAGTRAAGGARR